MSGCLDQFNYNCDIDWDSKRNGIASCISSAMFFFGLWLLIDTAAVYTPIGQWSNSYIIVTVVGTIAMFMVNAVSNSQIREESMDENMLGTEVVGYLHRLLAMIPCYRWDILHAVFKSKNRINQLSGSRLWLMFGFVLSFSSLVAALWIMFAHYVLVTGDHPIWPGVALFLHNFLIFISSLIYKFGRTEELWG